jgi:transposase
VALRVRELIDEEKETIKRLAQSRTAPARLVERARIIWLASQGWRVRAIAAEVRLNAETVRLWLKRFNAAGLEGLQDAPRAGRPAPYTPAQVGAVIAAALTNPQQLGLPFGCWTLDRLEAYRNEEKGLPIKRSRIDELLLAEGLCWRTQETWFGERATVEAPPDQQTAPTPIKEERAVDPDFAQKRGAITTLYTAPPAGSVTVCLDQMGPESAKSFPGQQVVRARPDPDDTRPAERARQEIDYGRRGSGYIFGAFTPADGAALTAPYDGRTIVNWVDFLEHVEAWIPPEMERV